MRIYHDNTVPQEAINKLLEEGAELVDVSGFVLFHSFGIHENIEQPINWNEHSSLDERILKD